MPATRQATADADTTACTGPLTEDRYPPRDPGLPVLPPPAIVGAQAQLMAMLRLHAAVEPAVFECRFAGPIERLADMVNVLPGSASMEFAGSAGLFRAALEAAVACFRGSDGRIFTGDLGVEARHLLEPRWRYLCFVAGLLFPVGRPLRQMTVVGAGSEAWSPELDGLTSWAARNGTTRLFVSWTGGASEPGPGAVTATFALDILGPDNIDWMNRGSPALLHALLHIVTGRMPRGLVAAALVSEVWTAVRNRESVRCNEHWRRVTIGTQVFPYLLDAMVALSRSDWLHDNDKTLQADASGLCLLWPQAGRDISGYCHGQGTAGIPRTEPALLAMLVDAGLVESGIDGTGLLTLAEGECAGQTAVRVAQPGLLLAAPGGAALAPKPERFPSPPEPPDEAVEPMKHRAPEGERSDGDRETQANAPAASALPPDLVAGLSTEHAAILDGLVRRWRAGPGTDSGAHRCSKGAAFELRLLTDVCPDPSAFLARLNELGLLYVSLSTSGRLVYPISAGDGGDGGRAGASCFILVPEAMQRLGLS
jgi:hypothetical protein